jgi:hypothetical protein
MGDQAVLAGLLRAYAEGDLMARRALLDWLEENGDPRAEAVRQEAIDWDAVADEFCPGGSKKKRRAWTGHGPATEFNRFRWYVDCARVGADTLPEVQVAVRRARRRWLQGLFPEVNLPMV